MCSRHKQLLGPVFKAFGVEVDVARRAPRVLEGRNTRSMGRCFGEWKREASAHAASPKR